jgi:hypothetical protein
MKVDVDYNALKPHQSIHTCIHQIIQRQIRDRKTKCHALDLSANCGRHSIDAQSNTIDVVDAEDVDVYRSMFEFGMDLSADSSPSQQIGKRIARSSRVVFGFDHELDFSQASPADEGAWLLKSVAEDHVAKLSRKLEELRAFMIA